MKLPSVRLLAFVCCLGLLSLAVSCGKKNSAASPLAPTPAPAPIVAPTIAVPEAKTPIGGAQLTTLKPPLSVDNAVVTGNTGAVTYEFWVSELDSFPDNSQSSHESDIAQGDDGTTGWLPPSNLIASTKYYWRARATNGTITTDWSKTESFITNLEGVFNGTTIFDPLTNGRTVGKRLYGQGQFTSEHGGGWQSMSLVDGIEYDIPTCDSCTAEFDATNFGGGEGASIQVDVKWFSMGDANAWAGFSPFRDHPWKMHLEQRSDGDGTGMQLIWRNGAADADTDGDPEYGDHRGKYPDGGPNWGHSFDNKVWHFVIMWTRGNYSVTIGELGQPGKQWFPGAGSSGFFSGNHPYTPGNHRIELGCVPRAESMVGVVYRNFRLKHN